VLDRRLECQQSTAREIIAASESRRMSLLSRVLLAAILTFALVPDNATAESLDRTIQYLLDYVGKSDAPFIRNGQTHIPQEAVAHIKAKYEHFENEIKTPDDFIRLCASNSLQTGQPCLVRTRDGQEMHLDLWLKDALKKH
jgi:hypothetical protein